MIITDIIKESIKQWLAHYGIIEKTDQSVIYLGFIKEYEEYYIKKPTTSGTRFTEEDIKKAAGIPHSCFSNIEFFPEYVCLYTNSLTNKIYDEKLKIYCKVYIKNNEFSFVL
ncbi:MAG: hypothetical protein NC085_10305, partial [Muribaculaceae bacterium]|nr:hypothetical protein [Muribaculaceae bacterium]